MINSLLLSNFYPVIELNYRRIKRKEDELLYTVWPLVMVRNQLPTQVVNPLHSTVPSEGTSYLNLANNLNFLFL